MCICTAAHFALSIDAGRRSAGRRGTTHAEQSAMIRVRVEETGRAVNRVFAQMQTCRTLHVAFTIDAGRVAGVRGIACGAVGSAVRRICVEETTPSADWIVA